jgi:hypothetical protein
LRPVSRRISAAVLLLQSSDILTAGMGSFYAHARCFGIHCARLCSPELKLAQIAKLQAAAAKIKSEILQSISDLVV